MFDQYVAVAVAEINVCFYFRFSWRNISHIWSPPTAVDALCVHRAVTLGQVLWCMWVTVSPTRAESVELKSSLNLKSDIYLPMCWIGLSFNSLGNGAGIMVYVSHSEPYKNRVSETRVVSQLKKCWVELSSNSRMIVHFTLCVHCAVALGQVMWCMWITVIITRAESVKIKSSLNSRKWHLSARSGQISITLLCIRVFYNEYHIMPNTVFVFLQYE